MAEGRDASIAWESVTGVPVKLSDTPGDVRTAPPTLGQHTEQVMKELLGLSTEELSVMRGKGVFGG